MGKGGKHEHMRIWTASEDDIVRQLLADYGNRWKSIALHLVKLGYTDRTTSSVRNRFGRIVKAQQLDKSKLKNKCNVCGLKKRGHTCRGDLPMVDCGRPNVEATSSIATPIVEASETVEPLLLTYMSARSGIELGQEERAAVTIAVEPPQPDKLTPPLPVPVLHSAFVSDDIPMPDTAEREGSMAFQSCYDDASLMLLLDKGVPPSVSISGDGPPVVPVVRRSESSFLFGELSATLLTGGSSSGVAARVPTVSRNNTASFLLGLLNDCAGVPVRPSLANMNDDPMLSMLGAPSAVTVK